MRSLILALIPLAFLIAFPITAILVRLGHRLRTFDTAPIAGQVKAAPRKVPNTGGVAIFLAIAIPIGVGLLLLAPAGANKDQPWLHDFSFIPADLHDHMAGIAKMAPLGFMLVGSLLLLHVLGLFDDRKPLGPWIKLVIMAIPAVAIPAFSDSRLLTMLDGHVGGPWLSIAITALWLLVVTNAMNFMDNMDGLTAGVAAIAGSCFLGGTLTHDKPQWFVGACLALLIGACLGFLAFNFPWRKSKGASIFMGDSGSLVLGFLLGFLTVRTTYYDPVQPNPALAGGWYGVFMPLVILAVPIYDFVSVCVIRISQGRSPFVGDLQHLSHRLERRGLSRRDAVLVIYGLTGITAVGGISLGGLKPWQAGLVGVQTVLVLLVLAIYERRATANGGVGGEPRG